MDRLHLGVYPTKKECCSMRAKKSLLLMSTAFMLCGLVSCSGDPVTSSEGSSSSVHVDKDAYSFTYDVNYQGGNPRTISIAAGKRASYWPATRTGYTLDNWYTTKDLTTKFDFNTAINDDTTVYAKWTEVVKKEEVSVTFDYNYGERKPTVVTAYKGETLLQTKAPDPERLGYEVEGWYTDTTFLNKFVFNSTILTGDITLYAKYTDISNFEYNEDGSIKYDNVTFNLAVNDNWVVGGSAAYITEKVNKFNIKYKGKIKVSIVDNSTTGSNDVLTAKLHQTSMFNRSSDYYNIKDVLDLAKIEYDESDFYADAVADCYNEGNLYSYPFVQAVPALVVNKEMLTKYSTAYAQNGTLPSTYKEFTSLIDAYRKGEGSTKEGVVADAEWVFYENGANIAWGQNDAPQYRFNKETGAYYNDWVDSDGNATEKAVTTARTIYDYFAPNGAYHGSYKGAWDANNTLAAQYNKVKTGDALFCIASIDGALGTAYDASKTIAMPVTNFFNKSEAENAKTFIMNYSYDITTSGPNDLYKKAAAAVFIDWLSKNTSDMGKYGVIPARKSIYNSSAYQNNSDATAVRLRSFATDPETYYTLPGTYCEYAIYNNKDNGYFGMIADLDEWNEEEVKATIETLAESISSQIK